MFTNLSLWILFLPAFSQTSLKMASARTDHTTCSLFRLLVIWHTSNGQDAAFIYQRGLIARLVNDIPQGTEVQVTAINTQPYHLLHFQKNTTINRIYNISMYDPETLENHTIQGSLINELVFSFLKQTPKKEVAEMIVLVVSEKTLIEKSLEMIKNIKTCVAFTGMNPSPSLWTSQATDKHHVVMLNTTSGNLENMKANIDGAADTILNLLCLDSRLACDTDEYWAGKRCISCSYICSADAKKQAYNCSELCPYYRRHFSKNVEYEAEDNISGEIMFIYCLSCLSLGGYLVILVLAFVAKKFRKIQKSRKLTQPKIASKRR